MKGVATLNGGRFARDVAILTLNAFAFYNFQRTGGGRCKACRRRGKLFKRGDYEKIYKVGIRRPKFGLRIAPGMSRGDRPGNRAVNRSISDNAPMAKSCPESLFGQASAGCQNPGSRRHDLKTILRRVGWSNAAMGGNMKLQDHPAVDGWIMTPDMRQRDEDGLARELLTVNRDRQFAIDPREVKPGFFWAYTVKVVAKMCFGGWWHEYYQCAAGIIWEVYREEGHLSRCVRPMDNSWHYEQYPMPTE